MSEILSEEEAFEAAQKTLEDVETRKAAPQWLFLIIGAAAIAFVMVMVFTNGFGIFGGGAANPAGVYVESAGNFLSLNSASYEMTLTRGGVTERATGWFVLGRDFESSIFYDERERVTGGAGFMSATETVRTVIHDGTMAVSERGGAWRNVENPASEREFLSGLFFPLPLLDRGSMLTWERAVGRNRLSESAYVAEMKTRIKFMAHDIGLTLSDRGIDELWQISTQFVNRILDGVAASERSFNNLTRVREGGIETYTFDLNLPGMLQRYWDHIRGAGTAPGYAQLRRELSDFARARGLGSNAFDAVDMILEELMAAARELDRISVTMRIEHRSRTLHELNIVAGDAFTYSLVLSEHNSVTRGADDIHR
jgi:hypothetical protein